MVESTEGPISASEARAKIDHETTSGHRPEYPETCHPALAAKTNCYIYLR